jgi:hypothetical protein
MSYPDGDTWERLDGTDPSVRVFGRRLPPGLARCRSVMAARSIDRDQCNGLIEQAAGLGVRQDVRAHERSI